MIQITDPAKSMERVYARIHETEEIMECARQDGLHVLIPGYQRRLRALRATATRLANQLSH